MLQFDPSTTARPARKALLFVIAPFAVVAYMGFLAFLIAALLPMALLEFKLDDEPDGEEDE